MAGSGAKETMKTWYAESYEKDTGFGAERTARSLGPRLMVSGSAAGEINERAKATNVAYRSMSGLWKAPGVCDKLKRMLYHTMVYSTLVSGMCAFALTESDCKQIQKETFQTSITCSIMIDSQPLTQKLTL